MQKKSVKIILFLIIFGSLLFLSFDYFLEREKNTLVDKHQIPQASLKEAVKEKVLYLIDKGNGEVLESRTVISPDSTVFSSLEKLSKENNFGITFKEYKDMGILVESIDGVKNGTDGKYWLYYVNEKPGEIAADRKTVAPGDKIEWRFEASSF